VKSPEKEKPGEDSVHDDSELYQEEEADNLYFEPVIPLPDKVEVVTGEEGETAVYTHRAKLFRLVDGEWKERGIGDVKILKAPTGRVRLLMRRDQVLKICLNHALSPELVEMFREKDAKSWTWVAQDFSEGALTTMTFALRFKTAEIAQDFKAAAAEAVQGSEADARPGVKAAEVKQADVVPRQKTEDKEETKDVGAEDGTDLFPISAWRPVEEVPEEVELSFEGQGLKLNTAVEAAEVATRIASAATVHTLTLSANTVGIEAAGAIGRALEGRPEFRRAHWKDMFTGRMKTEIPPALVNLTRGLLTAQARLVELDLSDNAFGPVGMEGLKTFLQSPCCYSLRELKLNNTGCGVTGGKMLAGLLLKCFHASKAAGHPLALKVFILGRSRLENEGGGALAEVFKLMGSLEEVVMPQNGIYHEGLAKLADAFSHNPNLRILNMNDNTFTAKGARAMGAALRKLDNLEVLNLGDCLLKSAGAALICHALASRHPGLRELVLDSNEIRLQGALEVCGLFLGPIGLVLGENRICNATYAGG
jgi:Ran GTPase-activating protein (RanGAP) involved in mRNA processing and transport